MSDAKQKKARPTSSRGRSYCIIIVDLLYCYRCSVSLVTFEYSARNVEFLVTIWYACIQDVGNMYVFDVWFVIQECIN